MSAYRIDHELGRGGMAIVYAGRQEELDRPVALKVLADHLAGNPEFRTRFLREARIAARLDHPNLVRTYDITELGGLPCIVMELLPGTTLEGARLSRSDAAQVADALAYAHLQGVVHRDLKPANLLRGASGEVKIADFGIARAAEETMLTEAGTVLGTLRYLSPEQAAGVPAGPASDIYSLGVVLGELLDEPDARLVARCTAAEPRDRPTAAQVAAALRAHTRAGFRIGVPGTWAAAVAAVGGILTVAVLVATDRSHAAPVTPVPHAATATQEARNLESWLRAYSR